MADPGFPRRGWRRQPVTLVNFLRRRPWRRLELPMMTYHTTLPNTLTPTQPGCHIWVNSKFPDISMVFPWQNNSFSWQFLLFFNLWKKKLLTIITSNPLTHPGILKGKSLTVINSRSGEIFVFPWHVATLHNHNTAFILGIKADKKIAKIGQNYNCSGWAICNCTIQCLQQPFHKTLW